MSTNQPEKIKVDDDVDQVSCDGGGGTLGHPVVWYSFDGSDTAECLYCDRLFVKKGSEKSAKDGVSASKKAAAAKKTAKKSKTASKKAAKKSVKKAKKRA